MSGAPAEDRTASGRHPAQAGPRVALLDYGMGNLRSVEKALERVGASVEVTSEPARIEACDGVILPGVGAFPRAMARIREAGLDRAIRRALGKEVPLLGICLGLQLLFESSDELGGSEGLGLLPGRVRTIPSGDRKVPHIGWSPVTWERTDPLIEGLRPGEPFYFVHSYACEPESGMVIGTASYGGRFACVAGAGAVRGVQFHPEKSGAAGLRLLRNFVRICRGER